MYKLKVNKFRVEFVTFKRMLVFKKYQVIAYPGDVIVHFKGGSCLFSKDDFEKIAEKIEVKEPVRKGKKKW